MKFLLSCAESEFFWNKLGSGNNEGSSRSAHDNILPFDMTIDKIGSDRTSIKSYIIVGGV